MGGGHFWAFNCISKTYVLILIIMWLHLNTFELKFDKFHYYTMQVVNLL